MSKKRNESPCAGGLSCGAIVKERNRWFTGKFVTARAYRTEQEHFLSFRWLHNRMLHGWGVAHGLRVTPHPDPECAERWVKVGCGMALDCCGRELLLLEDQALKLPLPEPGEEGPTEEEAEEAAEAAAKKGALKKGKAKYDEAEEEYGEDEIEPENGPEQGPEPWIVCLRYAEMELEPVPALQAEGSCDPKRREANSVRQSAVLEVVPISSFEDDCWLLPGGGEPKCRDDCDDGVPNTDGSCLEPPCPCGSCVPLALIYPLDPEQGWAGGYGIDMHGRRTLPIAADHLTHVAGINWPHGGELSLSQLRDDLGGKLEVRFDRRLLATEGEATGINEHTFVVQYGGTQQDLEFLSSNDEEGPTLENDCQAVFDIDPAFLTGKRTIAGNVIYVSLKCDFVLDCHGNPVDGDHLKGRLPSGNGIPGGTFESWFRVVADDAAKEAKK